MLGSSMRRRRGGRKPQEKGAKGKRKRRGQPFRFKRAFGVGGLGALIAFGAGYVVSTRVLFPAPPPPRGLVEVPDVRRLEEGAALAELEKAGFALASSAHYRHPTAPLGTVLGQAPLPGQLALPGDSVALTFSLGAERRPVPDVLRLREGWARNVLEATGFTVISDTLESELPKGRVVDVIPEPGTDVALPMEVTILVSTGPAQVRMPLLLGLERAEAEALLDSLGLVLEEVTTRFRFGRDQGRVVEQGPQADSLLDPGSGVRVVVGRRARGRGN
jgi:eukaryotic-like serine/threonine-protein kinase